MSAILLVTTYYWINLIFNISIFIIPQPITSYSLIYIESQLCKTSNSRVLPFASACHLDHLQPVELLPPHHNIRFKTAAVLLL